MLTTVVLLALMGVGLFGAVTIENEPTLFAIAALAKRWSVSDDLLRRKAETGELGTVFIGGRRLVHIDEVLRCEREGLGEGRRKGWRRPDLSRNKKTGDPQK
jgi:hypothetical protein